MASSVQANMRSWSGSEAANPTEAAQARTSVTACGGDSRSATYGVASSSRSGPIRRSRRATGTNRPTTRSPTIIPAAEAAKR